MGAIGAFNTVCRLWIGRLLKVLLGFMVLTILVQIVLRKLFGMSLHYVVDVNRLCFVWMSFLGAAYVYGKNDLIRFDILISRLPPRGAAFSGLLCGVAGLIFFVIMIVAGTSMTRFTRDQYFSTMKVSFFWLYIPLIVGGFLMAAAALEHIGRGWFSLYPRGGRNPKE
jgi:TRAP-type C4-dicarboxylate transport system permease small subunit